MVVNPCISYHTELRMQYGKYFPCFLYFCCLFHKPLGDLWKKCLIFHFKRSNILKKKFLQKESDKQENILFI